ncbi:hypothetical protein Pla52o_52290 [Novipirellula galeiformis]|uniref:Uncharacterized protein n=1 Tax=Novipirellula galeiformis TaxID=2528004 RepID=A0A5C6BZR8_9BACT|nr:hypothetical protein Pla52o_52290 [Novipirellula galeiformis]
MNGKAVGAAAPQAAWPRSRRSPCTGGTCAREFTLNQGRVEKSRASRITGRIEARAHRSTARLHRYSPEVGMPS